MADLDRDTKKLKPRLQVAWTTIRTVMWMLGHPVFLVEGYRTQERQDALWLRKITPATHSAHTDGEAVDVAFKGDDPYDEDHPWELLGMVAEALGLTWGGRFKSSTGKAVYDATHIQL
jgi:peptidoglycan L-alanyl-D-glutamate endopeptidase CwlK